MARSLSFLGFLYTFFGVARMVFRLRSTWKTKDKPAKFPVAWLGAAP
jgi:hypothetical protein